MKSYTYKSIAGCGIRADVHPAMGTHRGSGRKTPAVIWLHGGALMWGSCDYMTRPEQVELYTRAGYTFIAMDYRLAPESKLPDIVSDVLDGLRWVRERGPSEFNLDPARIGIIGHSAGGYLALLAGARASPAPQAIVSLYGYGDISAPWYTTPSAHALQKPHVTESDARAVIGTRPLSIAGRERGTFYAWCRQNGCWPREVVGLTPDADLRALDPWCPVRHVTPSYPPTFLAHGDQDPDVPHHLSIAMAKALQSAGVAHRLMILPGYGHVFDDCFGDAPVVEIFVEVLNFLSEHLHP